jgi:hypothetical protein
MILIDIMSVKSLLLLTSLIFFLVVACEGIAFLLEFCLMSSGGRY